VGSVMIDLFLRHGYAMVFVAAALEGDATLLTATFLVHRGYLRLDLVILVAATATIAINQVYFWIARGYGQQRVTGMRTHRVYGRVLRWITIYRLPLVVGSRFIYGFRIAIPAAAGAVGMSPLTFTIADVTGSVLWAGLVGFAGYAIGHVLDYLVDDLRAHEWRVAMGLFATAIAVLAWRGRDWLVVSSEAFLPRQARTKA
jgi:membrane protein DedA with SNARE-associated domain